MKYAQNINSIIDFPIKTIVLLLLTIFVFTKVSIAQETQNTFIPQPEFVKFKPGVFVLNKDTQVHISKAFASDLLPYIIDKIKNDTGLELEEKSGLPKTFLNTISLHISKDTRIKEEGYLLDISPTQIAIAATSYAGLFNGFQTLRQAIPINAKIKKPNNKIMLFFVSKILS